jgi:purine-nucleoside phosphorylase
VRAGKRKSIEGGQKKMSRKFERVQKCYQVVREKTDFKPVLGVVLGSGLGNYANQMEVVDEIPYDDIPGFPVSTVEGHDGRFLFGNIGKVPTVLMKGRVHYYEGYTMEDVVLPIRLMKLLGIETLLLTNAAGGINPTFKVGDFMVITDQISSFVPSPLIGENVSEMGERFTDMTQIYDLELQGLLKEAAKDMNIDVKEGVYVQASGPNFESPAEIRMFAALGIDAVGMSTTCEALVARHAGIRVAGVSCISNLASGISEVELSHDDVQSIANERGSELEQFITAYINKLV